VMSFLLKMAWNKEILSPMFFSCRLIFF
jgi:hypothetical protein